MRVVSCSVLIAAVAGFAASLYAFAFWAWVTATPVDAERLDHAQRSAGWWAAAAGVCLVLAIGAAVTLLRSRSRSRQPAP